jgi:predicted transcriptional regulator
MYREIRIRAVRKPIRKDPDEDIKWLCGSLGLCSGRDTEELSRKILIGLLQRFAEEKKPIASEDIAFDLKIKQARVNHHIRNLIESGFVYRDKKKIFLRGGSLKSTIEEIKKDTERVFDELINIAEEIDNSVGINNRK